MAMQLLLKRKRILKKAMHLEPITTVLKKSEALLYFSGDKSAKAQDALKHIDSEYVASDYRSLLDWLLVVAFNDFQKPTMNFYYHEGPPLRAHVKKPTIDKIDNYLVRWMETLIKLNEKS